MKNKLFFSLFLLFLNTFSANSESESVQIFFHPTGLCRQEGKSEESITILIYDNENKNFSDMLIKKIEKAPIAYFYRPHIKGRNKRCNEGYYSVIIKKDKRSYKYQVNETEILDDIERDKFLRCNIISDIYTYLAKEHLKSIVLENGREVSWPEY